MRLFAFVIGLLLCLTGAAQADSGRRVALVVGNAAYEGTRPLANPVNDATAMAEKLKGLGFEVILATDIDRRGAVAAIGQFSRAIDGAAIALFYFAGHGMQLGGQNLLLPTDVAVDSEWALRSSAIEAQEIVAVMERRAEVAIAILDACRDNPYVDVALRSIDGGSRSAAVERGLGPMRLTGRGALIAYAAAAGDVAGDGSGAHSPFAAALLAEIDMPDVEVGLMFRKVARRVRDETRGDQHPELLVRLVDEVYLNPTVTATPVAAAAAPAVPPPAMATPPAAGTTPVVVADASRQAAPGRAITDDRRFFGTRVIHQPAWSADIAVPAPSGWRSAAPSPVAEADGSDSFGRAQPLPLAAAVEVRITPRGDTDWFRVDVPSAGELRLTTTGQPADIDPAVRVLDADGRDVAGWQVAAKPGADLDARFPLPGPGSYRIELADSNNDHESSAAFTLSVDFVAADDPFEPNGSRGAARPLPASTTVKPVVFPRGDNDWFKVWVAEPGLLEILATDVPETLDIAIQVLDLDGRSLSGWIVPDRKGGDTVYGAELARPGTYLIQVADSNNDAAATDPFTLSLAFTPVADDAEPNEAFGDAVIVPATGNRKGAIFPRGDTDWLAIDVDHPGELQLLATKSPKALDIHFNVFNADKQSMTGWIPPTRKGGDNEASVDLPAPGRYFIQIADGNNDAASPDLFDLSLTFTAQPDQYEPNDAPADAVPLTLGGTILFNVLPRGDNDWFRIEVATPGELSVLIEESAETLDLTYQVFNADLASLTGWVPPYRKGGVAEGIADLPAPGVYYLQIADSNNDARSIDHATLTTGFTPAADAPLEPNDTFAAAVPLILGEGVRGNIMPRGDSDWYLVEAPRAGSFVITVDEVDAEMDIVVQLFDGDIRGGGWIGPARKGGVTEASIAVPAAGTYRLVLTDSNNDARSAKPYRLTVAFE